MIKFALGLGIALATVVPAQAAPSVSADGEDSRVVCRRVIPTGSLTATAKICRSEDRWKRGLDDKPGIDPGDDEQLLSFDGLPASGQLLQVGSAKWDSLPRLDERPTYLPYTLLIDSVEEMLRKKECVLPDQSARSFDIEVPFAVLVEPDGSANRVLVGQVNCAPLESLVGMTALARARRGDFKPTGEAKPRWYGSRINFTLTS